MTLLKKKYSNTKEELDVVATHLVNHQNVTLERKPAVVSGQGFWEDI